MEIGQWPQSFWTMRDQRNEQHQHFSDHVEICTDISQRNKLNPPNYHPVNRQVVTRSTIISVIKQQITSSMFYLDFDRNSWLHSLLPMPKDGHSNAR